MASVKVDFEVGNDGVAVITMCNPPVNALAIPSEFHQFFNLCFAFFCQFFYIFFLLFD